MKKLCTVQLSRKLLPGMDSYSLGKLCKELNIEINGRHRAAGDALATVKLFDILLAKDNNRFIKLNADKVAVPAHLSNDLIKPLPEETGVYYFFDHEDNLIYIGKSKNIHSRIVSHFNNTKTKKALTMQQQIKRIDYELTGSELIALLKESEEIKTELPIYNRAQRKSLFNYGIYLSLELDGYIHCRAMRNAKNQKPLIACSSLQEAKAHLRQLVDENELCLKLSGLYQTEGACFYHQIERCKGACIGKESISEYNARLTSAFEKYHYKEENLIIVDKGRNEDEKSVVLVNKGTYLGYGYIDKNELIEDADQLYNFIDIKKDTKDVHQIIRNFLKNNRVEKVISY